MMGHLKVGGMTYMVPPSVWLRTDRALRDAEPLREGEERCDHCGAHRPAGAACPDCGAEP